LLTIAILLAVCSVIASKRRRLAMPISDRVTALLLIFTSSICGRASWCTSLETSIAMLAPGPPRAVNADVPGPPWAIRCKIIKRKATTINITIDIKPEVQTELHRQAAAHGVDIAVFAANLLEEAARLPAGSKALSRQQLDRTLQELAQFSHKVPLLPDDAFLRESLYRDHD
jgi:hypothetical protein